MTQKELISSLSKRSPNAVIIGSLGTISNDLAEIPHKNKILVKGAMGCAIAIGLGYAINSKKKVIVVIGDGSALMKLGSLTTVNRYKPNNLEILIINNGVYASTGGQENNWLFTDDCRFDTYRTSDGNQKG